MAKGKAYKIRNLIGSKRFGVVADSVDTLLGKATTKLCLKTHKENIRLVLHEDGTEIGDDSYLLSLAPQTIIVALESSEKWHPEKSNLTEILDVMLHSQKLQRELASKIKNDHDLRKLFSKVVSNHDETKADAESREEDPEWFEELDTKFHDKETVMRNGAERRIRGYLRLVQDNAKDESDSNLKKTLRVVISHFKTALKNCNYHGSYFARSATCSERFCDKAGWFSCEGAHGEDKCTRHHIINPYANRDARILFSTWNLDHQIEKSREILPSLREAIAAMKPHQVLNWRYFYDLLFTRCNLKLVHTVCHDKKVHDSYCDSSKFYCTSC